MHHVEVAAGRAFPIPFPRVRKHVQHAPRPELLGDEFAEVGRVQPDVQAAPREAACPVASGEIVRPDAALFSAGGVAQDDVDAVGILLKSLQAPAVPDGDVLRLILENFLQRRLEQDL
jgi:hypothetical protein